MRPEDTAFAELVVAQGLCSREKVDECLDALRKMEDAGVSPLPTLGELLRSRGYLSSGSAQATLRAGDRTPPARPPSSATPPEIEQAARDPENVLGSYVRVSRIGTGGMGEVWRAWDRELGRWIALKFLKGRDPEEVARFQREAQTAARLSHPNIAAVHAVGELAGRPFIAMQLIDGPTLAAFPRDDRRVLIALVRDAALAVQYAHEQGVVHRDLKPQNIMVETKGRRVFVMDFGLAKQASADSSLSVSGSVLGTPAYMAPEQARGRLGDVGPRSDVYSLGATLYDLLAGRPPFQGADVYELLKRVIEEGPSPLRTIDPRIDEDSGTIVSKCLEKDPARRYATAQELADDLTRLLEGEPIAARPASVAYRVKKRILKNVALSVAVAAAVAIALAAGAVSAVGAIRRAALRDALFADSERSHARKDWARAIETLGQYLAIRPGDERALAMKADCERALAEQKKEAERLAMVEAASKMGQQAMEHVKEAKALLRSRASRREQWEKLFGDALAIANAALEKYPDLAASHATLGEIREAQGRWREAIESFDRALALDATLAEAWRRRGGCWLEIYAEEVMMSLAPKAGVWVVAESTAARRAREEPSRRAALESFAAHAKLRGLEPGSGLEEQCMKAAIAIADGRNADGERECDRLLEKVRTEERVWLIKAAAQHAQARYDTALATLNALILDVVPHDSRAHLMRAWTRSRLDDWEGALADCNRAIELDPGSSKAYLVRGMARGRLMDLFGALKDIDAAVKVDPKNLYGYTARARARFLLKDWKGVVDDCTRAIEINPGHSWTFNSRARARMKLGESKEAFEDFIHAVELDPRDEDILDDVIRAKLDEGDRPGLFKILDRLVEHLPGEALPVYRRARLHSDFGEFAPSLSDYDKAIALSPGQAAYHHFRGHARSGVNDWKGSEEDFLLAVKMDPGNGYSHAGLGLAKLRLGEPKEALKECDEALRLAGKDATLYPIRGRVRMALKDHAGALEDFNRAVALWDALESEVAPLIAECRKQLPDK